MLQWWKTLTIDIKPKNGNRLFWLSGLEIKSPHILDNSCTVILLHVSNEEAVVWNYTQKWRKVLQWLQWLAVEAESLSDCMFLRSALALEKHNLADYSLNSQCKYGPYVNKNKQIFTWYYCISYHLGRFSCNHQFIILSLSFVLACWANINPLAKLKALKEKKNKHTESKNPERNFSQNIRHIIYNSDNLLILKQINVNYKTKMWNFWWSAWHEGTNIFIC